MGLINELPINMGNAIKVNESHMKDPFKLAKVINDSDFEENNNQTETQNIFAPPASRLQRLEKSRQMPLKPIFGGDLPIGLSLVTPFEERKYM